MYSAIILSAGSGTRMQLGYNKMLFEYKGKTLLEYSLELFCNSEKFNQIILVIAQKDYEVVSDIIACNNYQVEIVIGGENRQNSVVNGLEKVKNEWVFIHDGARIFLTDELLTRLDNKRKEVQQDEVDGFALAVKSIDTTLKVQNDVIVEKLDRKNLYLMQTPQVSRTDKLKKILNNTKKIYTDEMSAFLINNKEVHIVESEYYNKKITTLEDIDE